MFDDSRVGLVVTSVVDDGISLIVRGIFCARLETDRAPVEFAESEVKIFVDGSRVDEFVGNLAPVTLVFGKEVYSSASLDTGEQAVDELVVAADGDALVLVVEVVVIEHEAYREALDDERRQVLATAAPLLLGVFLDEFLKDIPAHKRERLFFEIRGLAAVQDGERFGLLLLDFRLCFCRSQHAPHLVERVHVEWQVVKLSLVVGNGAVRVAVKFHDGIHEVPHLLVAGMEDVRAVLMDVYPLDVFAIDVTAQLGSFVYDKAFLARLVGAIGKCSPKQTRTDDEVIVIIHILSPPYFFINSNKIIYFFVPCHIFLHPFPRIQSYFLQLRPILVSPVQFLRKCIQAFFIRLQNRNF